MPGFGVTGLKSWASGLSGCRLYDIREKRGLGLGSGVSGLGLGFWRLGV